MITADSSVWIDYLGGRNTRAAMQLDAVLDDSSRDIVLLDVVLMEVLRGFRFDHERRMAKDAFAVLPVHSAGGVTVALKAASMYRSLRSEGVTVRSSIDLLIGAWCIENDCSLIHSDRDRDSNYDFSAMPGHGLQFWSQ